MADDLGQVVSWYICTATAVVFLAVRVWIRVHRFKALGVDDCLIILSACCLIGDLAIQQYMWNLGMSDIPHVSRENFIQIMQMIIPGSILYVTSLWTIKFALVLFYKRIAAPGSKLQMLYNATLLLLAASFATLFFDIIFQCYPNDRRWSSDPTYQCDPASSVINYWLTILLNIGSDILIISLPISMVIKLQMKMRQKLAVAGIFALGIFVVIASIIRAYYSKRNETMLTCTVSMIETAVSIIAACLPALRSLLLGHSAKAGVSSNYGHYELSSAGIDRTHRACPHPSLITTTVIGGAQSRDNDSEDELVKDAGRSGVSGQTNATEDKCSGISVSTTVQVECGMAEDIEDPKERHNDHH